MTTLEMYDASHRPLTVSDWMLGSFGSETLSSYRPIDVKIYTANFFFTMGVKVMSITTTLRGITTQLLLMGTVTDQIYAMNKRFLDPRRPIRPTAETQEERLLPYAENLPLIPAHFATYNRHILDLRVRKVSFTTF